MTDVGVTGEGVMGMEMKASGGETGGKISAKAPMRTHSSENSSAGVLRNNTLQTHGEEGFPNCGSEIYHVTLSQRAVRISFLVSNKNL